MLAHPTACRFFASEADGHRSPLFENPPLLRLAALRVASHLQKQVELEFLDDSPGVLGHLRIRVACEFIPRKAQHILAFFFLNTIRTQEESEFEHFAIRLR